MVFRIIREIPVNWKKLPLSRLPENGVIWNRTSCLVVQKKRRCVADLRRLYNTSCIRFNGELSYATVPDSISLHL